MDYLENFGSAITEKLKAKLKLPKFGGGKSSGDGAIKSLEIGSGSKTDTEKYDNIEGQKGSPDTVTNGPILNPGVYPVDPVRNAIKYKLNGNIFDFYALGSVGSIQILHHITPTGPTAGYGNFDESFGTRMKNELPKEPIKLEYDAEYNLVMQPITILDEGAARWGEEIALEIEFNSV